MDILKRLTIVGTFAVIVPLSLFAAGKLFSDAKHPADSGTFQLITDPSVKRSFPKEFIDSMRLVIASKRDSVNVVFLDICPGTKMMILPQKQIESKDFEPVAEFVQGNVRLISSQLRK